MAILDLRQRTGYVFLAVTLAHVVLISTQVPSARGVPLLEDFVFRTVTEIQRATTGLRRYVQSTYDEYIALQDVRVDNERLRAELAQMQIRLQQEQEVAAQTRTLQALLLLQQRTPLQTVAASIIGGGASPEFRTITLDTGSDRGIARDMAVVAPGGVVGRVVSTGPRAAKVQLLIDRNAAAGVVDERTRAQGVIVGLGDGLQLSFLSSTADVQKGDTLVTSGIDGLYPRGLVVGQVESVVRNGSQYGLVRVRPSVDFPTLENVLVVTSLPAPVVNDAGAEGQE